MPGQWQWRQREDAFASIVAPHKRAGPVCRWRCDDRLGSDQPCDGTGWGRSNNGPERLNGLSALVRQDEWSVRIDRLLRVKDVGNSRTKVEADLEKKR
jgi:hypothetical protein